MAVSAPLATLSGGERRRPAGPGARNAEENMRALLGAVALSLAGALGVGALAEEKVPLAKVPKAALDAVKAKFPGAKLTGAEKEKEDGKDVYEIAITHKGRK